MSLLWSQGDRGVIMFKFIDDLIDGFIDMLIQRMLAEYRATKRETIDKEKRYVQMTFKGTSPGWLFPPLKRGKVYDVALISSVDEADWRCQLDIRGGNYLRAIIPYEGLDRLVGEWRHPKFDDDWSNYD